MKNIATESILLIADSYKKYHRYVYLYIYYRIRRREEAEDIAQEVFLRLMEYGQMLCSDTIKSFIYTITQNLVTDYLRRYYKTCEVNSFLYQYTKAYTEHTESNIIAKDLLNCERQKLKRLPSQRRQIYTMSRFEGKSALEISQILRLSIRTVEGHLFIGRKEIREYIKRCI